MASEQPVVGVLHPGRMGAGIAGEARANAREVLWCSDGRSAPTGDRAASAGLVAVTSLAELVDRSQIILSICPPAFAVDLAAELGQYDLSDRVIVEANPTTDAQLSEIRSHLSGADVVDGGIIGSVLGSGRTLALYVSGPPAAADAVEQLFQGTQVVVQRLGDSLGQASALKLAYSTFQKGSRVLAALADALASDHGVQKQLLALAQERRGSYLAEPDYVAETAALAWRWAPELVAAGDQLDAAGLPGDAIRGLADALRLWEDSRDAHLTPAEAVAAWRRRKT